MAQRWKGVLNLTTSRRKGGVTGEFRVLASLACTSSGSLLVPASNAIFFVGDRVMESGNPVVERLSQLENIAAALLPKLGQAVNLWIMEPSHYNGPFACYENILPRLTASGEPIGYKPQGLPAATACLSILHKCLAQVRVAQLCSKDTHSTSSKSPGMGNCSSGEHLDKASSPFEPFLNPVHTIPSTILLGFSKGGIILNQMLAEIVLSEESGKAHDCGRLGSDSKQDKQCMLELDEGGKRFGSFAASVQLIPSTVKSFLSSIEAVHYIDVGLNCQGAYQTDRRLLEGLAKAARSREGAGLHVGIHGTPRQWQDRNRRWVAIEKKRCVELLKEAALQYGGGKLHISERLYFGTKPPDLQMHFEIIDSLVFN